MDDNQDQQMQVISQLMEELQELMGPNEDDFSSRLGRDKPDMSIMKIESDGDDDMGDDYDDMDNDYMDDDYSPGDKLKSRLMKLRG